MRHLFWRELHSADGWPRKSVLHLKKYIKPPPALTISIKQDSQYNFFVYDCTVTYYAVISIIMCHMSCSCFSTHASTVLISFNYTLGLPFVCTEKDSPISSTIIYFCFINITRESVKNYFVELSNAHMECNKPGQQH